MLKREISEKLKLWRTQKNKKALCIIGARQIGKTTIIREFAKQEYENFIEINFILDKGAEKIFEDKLDADTIIENLTAFKMQKMESGKTFAAIPSFAARVDAIKFINLTSCFSTLRYFFRDNTATVTGVTAYTK